ncbi:MAG: flagellar export chaperone FlgN [Phycisphaeraceae bacterium]|nr:flagellar export chaperone FlgN [Phycisphaeraceae bacterium]
MTAHPLETTEDELVSPQQMLPLLQQQRDGYVQLLEIGRDQSQLIQDGQPEQLLTLLSQRQKLIDDLARLGRRVAAVQDRWRQVSDQLDGAHTQQVRSLVAQVEQLLSQIIAQDEKDRAQLEAAHKQTAQQLSRTAAAPRALNAYKAAVPLVPRYTDRNG